MRANVTTNELVRSARWVTTCVNRKWAIAVGELSKERDTSSKRPQTNQTLPFPMAQWQGAMFKVHSSLNGLSGISVKGRRALMDCNFKSIQQRHLKDG